MKFNPYLKKKIKFYFPVFKNSFSFFYIASLSNIYLKKNNFESARRFISRKFKKKSKFSIYKSTYKLPTFKKPSKNRMGKGKFSLWVWLLKKKY